MIRHVIVIALCILPASVLGGEDQNNSTTDTKLFMAAVDTLSPILHDSLVDVAVSYLQKCGKVPDVATLKKIAQSDAAFEKMFLIRAKYKTNEQFIDLDLEQYTAAAKGVSCVNEMGKFQ